MKPFEIAESYFPRWIAIKRDVKDITSEDSHKNVTYIVVMRKKVRDVNDKSPMYKHVIVSSEGKVVSTKDTESK